MDQTSGEASNGGKRMGSKGKTSSGASPEGAEGCRSTEQYDIVGIFLSTDWQEDRTAGEGRAGTDGEQGCI
ncbi:hypothetical protein MHI12_10030 [Paenibacillus sp. FSL H8-0280]|uniref:hypothetical protein n=1 Tax=Paenibacillus sp. FSL H8-0280 TaxID=2921382 RepID=UPI00325258AC